MNKTITLASGKELEMTMQSFSIASSMFKVLSRELKEVNLKGDVDVNFKKVFSPKHKIKDDEINLIKDIFLTVSSCNEFEQMIFECFKKCLYEKKKVVMSLFDEDEEARADYLEMAWEVGKFNLSPFFKNLASLLNM